MWTKQRCRQNSASTLEPCFNKDEVVLDLSQAQQPAQRREDQASAVAAGKQTVTERCFSAYYLALFVFPTATRLNQKRKENVNKVLGLFQLKTR